MNTAGINRLGALVPRRAEWEWAELAERVRWRRAGTIRWNRSASLRLCQGRSQFPF